MLVCLSEDHYVAACEIAEIRERYDSETASWKTRITMRNGDEVQVEGRADHIILEASPIVPAQPGWFTVRLRGDQPYETPGDRLAHYAYRRLLADHH